MENEELEKLYFELSSENRLTILRTLEKQQLKMQEIAQHLDITATEAYRQLQRLTEAALVEKNPDARFTLTPYGRLTLHLTKTYQFTTRHRDYLNTHETLSLPIQFINRISELAEAKQLNDPVESINKSAQIFLEAEKYAWGISARGTGLDHLDQQMDERINKGIQFKLIAPENLLNPEEIPRETKNIEVRTLPETPHVIVLNEKEAAIFLPHTDGRIDYTGFTGTSPTFHQWTRELFLHHWQNAKKA